MPGTVCFWINLFFNKTKFAILKFIYFPFQTLNEQMIVFFQIRLGKILIWQKFSGMWESNFKSYMKFDQCKQCNTCKSLCFKKTFPYFFCLISKSTKSQILVPRKAIFLVPLNADPILVQQKNKLIIWTEVFSRHWD